MPPTHNAPHKMQRRTSPPAIETDSGVGFQGARTCGATPPRALTAATLTSGSGSAHPPRHATTALGSPLEQIIPSARNAVSLENHTSSAHSALRDSSSSSPPATDIVRLISVPPFSAGSEAPRWCARFGTRAAIADTTAALPVRGRNKSPGGPCKLAVAVKPSRYSRSTPGKVATSCHPSGRCPEGAQRAKSNSAEADRKDPSPQLQQHNPLGRRLAGKGQEAPVPRVWVVEHADEHIQRRGILFCDDEGQSSQEELAGAGLRGEVEGVEDVLVRPGALSEPRSVLLVHGRVRTVPYSEQGREFFTGEGRCATTGSEASDAKTWNEGG